MIKYQLTLIFFLKFDEEVIVVATLPFLFSFELLLELLSLVLVNYSFVPP